MHLINGLMARPIDDVAIVTANQSYLAGDVLRLAQSVRHAVESLGVLTGGCRVMVPTADPARLLAGILGLVGAGCTAIPWRQDTPELEASQRNLLRPDAWLHFDRDIHIELQQGEGQARRWIGDVILTTTGSTGLPKGVALTLEQLLINASEVGAAIELGPGATWGTNVDLGFTSGLCHLLTSWLRRWRFYFLKDAEPGAWNDVFRRPNSGFGGSPVQLAKFADGAQSDWRPAALMSSGDFLTAPMIGKIRRTFPHTDIYKFYGLTEVAGRFCSLPAWMIDNEPDAVGYPLPGFSARICDEAGEVVGPDMLGEIRLRSPLLAKGYVRQGDKFEPFNPEEWFRTGDLGFSREDGLLTVTGRLNDSFKVGGEKVDRITIETALRDILKDCTYCVLPHPHPVLGYCVALFVETSQGAKIPAWGDILQSVSLRLPARYVPMLGFGVGSIPRQQNGKVDRAAVLRLAETSERLA